MRTISVYLNKCYKDRKADINTMTIDFQKIRSTHSFTI